MRIISDGTTSIGSYDMKPFRKKPCLCVGIGNEITKYATFDSEESAELFMKILADFMGAKESEEE